MLKTILLNKLHNLHKPAVTWTLILCCILIGIPVYIFPELRSIFSTNANYPWWPITAIFVHDAVSIPLYLHFIGNVVVIFYFGTLTERLLGSTKVLLLVIISFMAQMLVSYSMNTYGDGASGIAWAFAPLVFPIIYKEWKNKKYNVFKDSLFSFTIILYVFIWIIISLISYFKGWHMTNVWHLAATIIGITFMLIFKKDIANSLSDIDSRYNNKKRYINLNTMTRKFVLLLPIFILLIYSGVFFGKVETSIANIVSVSPSHYNINTINDYNSSIIINFNKPMRRGFSAKTSITTEKGDLEVNYSWINTKSFLIKFTRKLQQDDKINIKLEFKDEKSFSVFYEIKL